jgi:RNA polymerase sigma factor (TIGR02999 family)
MVDLVVFSRVNSLQPGVHCKRPGAMRDDLHPCSARFHLERSPGVVVFGFRLVARIAKHNLGGRGAGLSVNDVTRILSALERGDPQAAGELLPLVYDELRKLAARRLAREAPGQTLEATALVHEAYVRLVDGGDAKPWNSRGHFFGAAAEAMRRILVENARRKASEKRGGGRRREDIPAAELVAPAVSEDLLALDEALSQLAQTDALAAELVKLRYFAGLTSQQAAAALGLSSRTADRTWSYARAWLLNKLKSE